MIMLQNHSQQKELMARISVILRRDNKALNKVYKFNGLSIDIDSHIVKIDDEIVHLTPKEFEVLNLLISNKNKVVTVFFNGSYGSMIILVMIAIDTH